MSANIKIGDYVRSYDFEWRDVTGERACYVEGFVREIMSPVADCDRYKIDVFRRVWGGFEDEVRDGERTVYPPVNGTRTVMGGTTNGVERLTGTPGHRISLDE